MATSRSHPSPRPNPYSKGLRVFNHSELLAATSDFVNLIGKGGFGRVYKGEYHGTELAVKVLNEPVVIKYAMACVVILMCVYLGFIHSGCHHRVIQGYIDDRTRQLN